MKKGRGLKFFGLRPWCGFLSFFIVLLSMPLGHALMASLELIGSGPKTYVAAAILGALGLCFYGWGSYLQKLETISTIAGFVGGIFLWKSVEILGRWGVFDEMWIKPNHYFKEMIFMTIAFVIGLLLVLLSARREQAREEI